MGFVATPESLSVGEDFMMLSSAKFVPGKIEVTGRVGVDLILPVAAMLPLERRVQWSERMEIPRNVLESLADGAETLAAVLIAGRFIKWIYAKIEFMRKKCDNWISLS